MNTDNSKLFIIKTDSKIHETVLVEGTNFGDAEKFFIDRGYVGTIKSIEKVDCFLS